MVREPVPYFHMDPEQSSDEKYTLAKTYRNTDGDSDFDNTPPFSPF